jgi:hypothetical protein
MTSSSENVSQQRDAHKNQLELEKSQRQEQSRAAVAKGAKALSDNFLITKEVARAYSFVFKG